MKRLLSVVMPIIISSSCIGTVASAATCQGTITLTGANSNNTISCTDVSNIVVSCDNDIVVATVNQQTGTSGGASAGGSATSGSVVNENGQDITVGSSCESPAATATDTSDTPGKGAFRPPSLPVTSGEPSMLTVTSGSAFIAALTALLYAGIRRMLRQSS